MNEGSARSWCRERRVSFKRGPDCRWKSGPSVGTLALECPELTSYVGGVAGRRSAQHVLDVLVLAKWFFRELLQSAKDPSVIVTDKPAQLRRGALAATGVKLLNLGNSEGLYGGEELTGQRSH